MDENSGRPLSFLDGTFRQAHAQEPCVGSFAYVIRKNIIFPYHSVAREMVAEATFAYCEVCGATYFAPGEEERILGEKARAIMNSVGDIPPRSLRFIRVGLGLTQDDMARLLGLSIFVYRHAEKEAGLPERMRENLASVVEEAAADGR